MTLFFILTSSENTKRSANFQIPEFPVLNRQFKITRTKLVFCETAQISGYSVILCCSQYAYFSLSSSIFLIILTPPSSLSRLFFYTRLFTFSFSYLSLSLYFFPSNSFTHPLSNSLSLLYPYLLHLASFPILSHFLKNVLWSKR